MKNALIFLPETDIYPYLRTLSIAGDALKAGDYNVYIFHCNKSLYRCPMMPNCGMPFNVSTKEKEKKCEYCANTLFKVIKKYDFNIIDGAQYNINLDNLTNILNDNPSSQWDKIHIDDIPIGEIGKLDLTLEAKVFNVEDLSEDQMILYKSYILTSYKVYQIICKIINDYKLDIVLTYNPYSQNLAAYWACKNNNVIFKNLTNTHLCGPSAKLIQICDGHPYPRYSSHSLHFEDGADYPVNAKVVQQSFSDSLFSMYGSSSHVFSSRKSKDIEKMCQNFGISTQKVVGVFTSSLDELVALLSAAKIMNFEITLEQAFTDQIEWLLALKNYFSKRNDVMVLVKVHPREFKGIESQNAKKLKEIFYNKDSSNFKFIWPDNDVSTYDLMEIIDCCLISHSTVGFECAKLGIPTLSFVKGFNYPNSLVIDVASNKEDYFKKLENVLLKKITLKDITYCCRYFNWIKLVNSFDLGEQLSDDFFDPQIGIRIDNKNLLRDVLENKIDYIRYNIENLKKEKQSEEEERKAILRNIKKVIEKIAFSEDYIKKNFLCSRLKKWISNITGCCYRTDFRTFITSYKNVDSLDNLKKETMKNGKLRFIVKHTNCVFLISNGVIYKKHSKLLLNLIELLGYNQ